VTTIIAHRGASKAERENTIAAFATAVRLGADGVELDVRRTTDDTLVVHHDPRLPDGRVVRATRSTDLPEHVPTLADALDACAGLFVNIEIKNDPSEPDFDPSDRVAHSVAEMLVRRGGGLRWLISSFRFETVDLVRAVLPSVRTAFLCDTLDLAVVERTVRAGHAAVHPWVETLDEAMVRAAHGAGLAVNAWTCDDETRIRELIAWGVDGICTNVPDVALAARRSVTGAGRRA
jgi:glycerophosphoryl diester phosphodiesterase